MKMRVKTFIKTCLAMFIIGTLLMVVIKYAINEHKCRMAWGESNIEWNYKFSGGCKVKTEDGWVPAENYRTQN